MNGLSPELLLESLGFSYSWLLAASVAMARAGGIILITPVFSRLGLAGLIRSVLAFVISVPVIPLVYEQMSAVSGTSVFFYAGILFKETCIGLVIGLIFSVAFLAAEFAGELVDLQRGSTMSQLVDPGGSESGVTGTLLSLMIIALFFMTGGFSMILKGLYESYRVWPVMDFSGWMGPESRVFFVSLLDRMMLAGIVIVAPLVVAVLISDVILAFMARAAPQLNIFDLSVLLKNLLFAVIMVLYMAYLVPVLTMQMADSQGLFSSLLELYRQP